MTKARDISKLSAVEVDATADQTNTEVKAAVEAASDSNTFTDADHSKLNAIEASADVTDTTNVTSSGALMDSELTNLAAVKAINQSLVTTASPTFGTVTATGMTATGANTNAATYATFQRSDAAVSTRIRYDGSTTTLFGTSTNHPLAFETNATPRITILSGGNVGIGDPSPDYKLHVNSGATNVAAKFESTDSTAAVMFVDNAGSAEVGAVGNSVVFMPAGTPRLELNTTGNLIMKGAADTAIYKSVANQSLYISGGTNTNVGANIVLSGSGVTTFRRSGDTSLLIDASGNVGIGVSPSAMESTYDALQIGSVGSIFSHASATAEGSTFFGSNIYNNSGWKYITTNEASFIQQKNGEFYFARASSGSAGATATLTYPMIIDSSGRVGIGTSSPDTLLQLQKTRATISGGTGDTGAVIKLHTTAQFEAGYNSSATDFLGGLEFSSNDTSGSGLAGAGVRAAIRAPVQDAYNNVGLSFETGGTRAERMRIDNNGNVGIGTASPSFESGTGTGLEIRNASGNGAHVKLTDNASGAGGSNGFDLYAFNTSGYIENYEAGSIIFRNGGAERMRIGNSAVTFNTTGSVAGQGVTTYNNGANGHYVSVTGTANYWITNHGVTSATGVLSTFYNNSTYCGGITISSTNVTTYASASDYRLKENVVPMTGATERLKQLNPVTFDWINSGESSEGFLAHEVGAIVPVSTVGTKDEVYDEEGSADNPNVNEGDPKYQSVDPAKLVPLLVKTIQELEARITILEA